MFDITSLLFLENQTRRDKNKQEEFLEIILNEFSNMAFEMAKYSYMNKYEFIFAEDFKSEFDRWLSSHYKLKLDYPETVGAICMDFNYSMGNKKVISRRLGEFIKENINS